MLNTVNLGRQLKQSSAIKMNVNGSKVGSNIQLNLKDTQVISR